MGKLYLYYKKHNNNELGDILKVKIDDNITSTVKKNEIYELELPEGTHNLKMYYDGWSEGEVVGYLDQNIEIQKDTFFTYKGPATIYGKGKLIKNNFNSSDEFIKYTYNYNQIYKILGIIFLILAIIILTHCASYK